MVLLISGVTILTVIRDLHNTVMNTQILILLFLRPFITNILNSYVCIMVLFYSSFYPLVYIFYKISVLSNNYRNHNNKVLSTYICSHYILLISFKEFEGLNLIFIVILKYYINLQLVTTEDVSFFSLFVLYYAEVHFVGSWW